MVRTEEDGLFLRHKTQVGGRSNRAILVRPMVCSALEDESRGNRENPESNGLDLITELRGVFFYLVRTDSSDVRGVAR